MSQAIEARAIEIRSQFRRTVFDSLMTAYLFCVLIVAIFQPEQKVLMNLKVNFGIFVLAAVFGGFLSFYLNRNSRQTLGDLIFQPAYRKATSVDVSMMKTVWGWQLLIFLVSTIAVGIVITRFSFIEILNEDGFAGAKRLFTGMVNANWELLPKAVLTMIETIFMAFMATAIAIPVAFILCFLSAKNIMTSPVAFGVYLFLRILMNVSRSIEAFIWAIIFSVWVGIGPFAGMLALMIHSIASLTKQYSEIVETVSDGPIEGIQATGASKLQTIWFAIVPQVFLPFISFTIYRWDINIRMATIVGFVGGGGIGTILQMYTQQSMWPEIGTIVIVISFVVWFMDLTSAYLREALK